MRIHAGTLKKGQQVAWIHYDDEGNQHIKNVKIAELLRTVGVDRESASEAMVAGDIAAISGIDNIMIGDTLADVENPVALPRITVDEPAISSPPVWSRRASTKNSLVTYPSGCCPPSGPMRGRCRDVARWPCPSWWKPCVGRDSN